MDEFSSMNLLLSVIVINTAISGRNRIQIPDLGQFPALQGRRRKKFVQTYCLEPSSLCSYSPSTVVPWRGVRLILSLVISSRKIIAGGFNALGFTFYRGVRTINLPAVAIG